MTDSNRQELLVYSVVPTKGDEQRLLEIGRAVRHPDQNGYSVYLQALPTNAELILRDTEVAAQNKPMSLTQRLEAYERGVIEQCLMETGGRIDAAMEKLDVPRRTLSEKIARLGIDRFRFANRRDGQSAVPLKRKSGSSNE